jgi:hypothetical protein
MSPGAVSDAASDSVLIVFDCSVACRTSGRRPSGGAGFERGLEFQRGLGDEQ